MNLVSLWFLHPQTGSYWNKVVFCKPSEWLKHVGRIRYRYNRVECIHAVSMDHSTQCDIRTAYWWNFGKWKAKEEMAGITENVGGKMPSLLTLDVISWLICLCIYAVKTLSMYSSWTVRPVFTLISVCLVLHKKRFETKSVRVFFSIWFVLLKYFAVELFICQPNWCGERTLNWNVIRLEGRST